MAIASVVEAVRRTVGVELYDVQLLAAIALARRACEMQTGEGKTLAATPATAILAVLHGTAHVVTTNDYLAERDCTTLRDTYELLGLSVGLITAQTPLHERREIYSRNIVFVSYTQLGFDVLRTSLATSAGTRTIQRFAAAIVDEVDSILIDAARVPVILSQPEPAEVRLFEVFAKIAKRVVARGLCTIERDARTVNLTEVGITFTERALGIENLYAPRNLSLVRHVELALRAQALFDRDVEYIVHDEQVVIVDQFTGRPMPSRRYADGLHQALEAKEGLPVGLEQRAVAVILLQHLFRRYAFLAGMSGTVLSDAPELEEVYGLHSIAIPTRLPSARRDYADRLFATRGAKLDGIVTEVVELRAAGRPVLIGTTSVETSETIAQRLRSEGIEPSVLNARRHHEEAAVIARAGEAGQVTVATNMAGRGVDIRLGPGVAARGGLHVIGTERHESRRIDDQLRGRSGRQGDPGSTRFYISLEDDLIARYGGGMRRQAERFVFGPDGVIELAALNRLIDRGQANVTRYLRTVRGVLYAYDSVIEQQRRAFERSRDRLVDALDASPEELAAVIADLTPDQPEVSYRREAVREALRAALAEVDRLWANHLQIAELLKGRIGFRAYVREDPRVAYDLEMRLIYEDLIEDVRAVLGDQLRTALGEFI